MRFGAFAQKTVGAGRVARTKNATEANDRVRRPQWRRTAFSDDTPKSRFSGLRNTGFEANAPSRIAIHE